jgi:predicted amidohydrolase
MKICVAQTRSVKGNIQDNIENHLKLIDVATQNRVDVIIFPELSLTGYEPSLSKKLATDQNDNRFNEFQRISNTQKITIGLGIPTKSNGGTCISMVLFQPHHPRQMYSKQYLHPDENDFFISGKSFPDLIFDKPQIAFAICYELSVAEHAKDAFNNGASIYIASVAKFVTGVDKAIKRLSEIAEKYSMIVLMSNCVGQSDGQACGGKTSIWNNKGLLVAQLNDVDQGLLIIDSVTHEIIEKYYNNGSIVE